ncbi:hypothetical protein [Micromonospora sp. IBHARD004]|uniref:hypothetical protein n=1 Tax=Micromonospora sp. IBHARD004 TaxID=3457764 RepID=UPI004058BD7A
MPATTTVPAGPTVGGHHAHGWRIVAALAVTSTVGYGTLYYAYAVLLNPMAASVGASTIVVTGALTAPSRPCRCSTAGVISYRQACHRTVSPPPGTICPSPGPPRSST